MSRGGTVVRWGTKTGLRPFRTMLQGLCLMLPLGGCLLADKPEPGLDIPARYDLGPRKPVAAEAALPPLDWWRSFRSRELTEIIEEARTANLDIAAAIARIVQADAQSRGGALQGASPTPDRRARRSATFIPHRCRRATRSTFGVKTARPPAPPKKPLSPAVSTAKWSG